MGNINILTTGATGFIGGHLLSALRDKHRMRALDRDASTLIDSEVEVVDCDLDDQEALLPVAARYGRGLLPGDTMKPGEDDFAERDREMAKTFVAAAEAEGVDRLICWPRPEPPRVAG